MNNTIMLVDDSLTLRQMLTITLKRDGHEIIEACNGIDALEKARGRDIDLIICDLLMPEMNGMDFLKQMKQDTDLKFKPVIMLTTEQESSIKEDARGLGVSIWKVKPFDPEDIRLAVKKLLRPKAHQPLTQAIDTQQRELTI